MLLDRVRVIYWLALLIVAAPSRAEDRAMPALVPDAEILDELRSAPRDNVQRVERLRDLYVQAGAQPEAVALQEVKGRSERDQIQHNVIVTKKGRTDRVIVVGGHLDKVPPGDGIIDDWSGASLAANLYQTILPLDTAHTFVFIGFAHEESGLLGSRAYVDSLGDDAQRKIQAMVNLECLGVDDTFIWTNGSTDSLEAIAHEVAKSSDLPLRDHQILGVGTDSIPFERVGIPNITFDGLPVDRFRLIHSDLDKFENVDQQAYLRTYGLARRFLVELDRRLAERPSLLHAADPRTVQKVEEYIEGEMARRSIPGLSLAVVQSGEIVLAKGYGKANVELDVPATRDTVYQIGSITKQFTATAIMMLEADGKVALDDPISKHIDDTPDAWSGVTVRHLLNHTSGIKSYTSIPENMKQSRMNRSKRDILGTIRDVPLEFAPGASYSYNNTGYFLLGMIVEKASGMPYSEFLRQRVFEPLEMGSTRVNRSSELVAGRAAGYGWGRLCAACGVRVAAGQCDLCGQAVPAEMKLSTVNAEPTSMTWPFAAGAMISSVVDLARWDAALYSDRVLPAARLRDMWTPATLSSGKTQDYGYGWAVGEISGRRWVGHGGGIHGFSTDIVRFVDDKLTVIVLTNFEGSNPGGLARRIAGFYVRDLAR